MTQHRVARKTARQKSAWETQAREEARRIGVSEATMTQQVKAELIRLVAEKIAKEELQRLRAEKDVPPGEAPARPLSEVEKTALREKVWMPPKDNRP
jgi:hypothetical protein